MIRFHYDITIFQPLWSFYLCELIIISYFVEQGPPVPNTQHFPKDSTTTKDIRYQQEDAQGFQACLLSQRQKWFFSSQDQESRREGFVI